MKKSGIYCLTSPSGKCYIGRAFNLKSRLNKYKNGHNKEQQSIYKAIMKYGWNSFKINILWDTDDNTNLNDILNELEIDFINIYNCISPNGYNLKGGGNGNNISEETKLKLSESSKKQIRTDENIKNFIDGGIKTRFKKGQIQSKESIEKRRLKLLKPIAKLDLITEDILDIYNSKKEAAEVTKINSTNISRCANGERLSAGGFKWKYL